MISIIVSTIGSCPKRYMQEAISSALQTTSDIAKEIIIIENSQDETIFDFFSQFKNDPRVKIYRSDTRLGMADCWNMGLNKCTQKWHLLLHDDDIINHHVFNTIPINLLQKEEIGFISFDFFVLRNKRKKYIKRSGSLVGIIENTPKFVSTIVHNENFRKIGGWDKKSGYALDLLQFIKLHQLFSSSHIKKPLGHHRIHKTNASSKSQREKGYSKDLPYILSEIYELVSDTQMRRKVTFHLTSFSYPHKYIFSRILSYTLGKMGKKLWFEKG